MKLRVGIQGHSPGWEQICIQEGIPFVAVDLRAADLDCSVLAVTSSLDPSEREAVEGYLRHGGAVIGAAQHLEGVGGTAARKEPIEYLTSDHDTIFEDIGILDCGTEGMIPREANALRTQVNTQAVFAGQLMGGAAVILPFDVEMLLRDIRPANKNFYFTRDRLPSERVSLVAKGEVRHLLHRAFEYLHHVRGIPYVHCWYYPSSAPLFAFRVDTDGAPREDVDALYRVANDCGVAMSWFVDVKSHEEWLNHFTYLAHQEIGVHCYDHAVFPTFEENHRNIMKARHLLQSVGIPAVGFASPFGIWTPELAHAIEEAGFEYSSEFGCAYDTLPFHPQRDSMLRRTLQIPIHPISIGSLRRIGYTEAQMIEYYRAVVEWKIARSEPLFFYSHPAHRHWDVIRTLIGVAVERGADTVTLGAYARWWTRRATSIPHFELHDEKVLRCVANPPDRGSERLWMRVTTTEGGEAIEPLAEDVDLRSLRWGPRKVAQPPSDLRRIREFDPRRVLGDLFTSMTRRMR